MKSIVARHLVWVAVAASSVSASVSGCNKAATEAAATASPSASHPAATPPPATPPLTPPSPASATTPASPGTPAVAAAPIGWSADLRHPPHAAHAKNSDALALHRRHDYEGSLAGFEAAIALAPDYTMAHYNRACALSRLGRMADAATELESVMRTDLVEFGKRLETDEDLAPLMAAAEGARLLATRTVITADYAAAVARGIPVVTYDSERIEVGASQSVVGKRHRAGVFLPDSDRFVPITPVVEHSFGVVWSSATSSVIVLHGTLASLYWQVFPEHFSVDVYSLTSPGTVVASAPRVDGALARLFPAVRGDTSEDAEDSGWAMAFGSINVHPFTDGVQIEADVRGEEQVTTIRVDIAAGQHPTAARAVRPNTALYNVRVVEGVVSESLLPAGYSFHRTQLTVPGRQEPIELGRMQGFKQLVVASDQSAAFVLAVRADCDALEHRLVRVDLHTFEVRQIDTGRTGATLVASPDGTLYVQLGAAAKRLAPSGELTDAALPAWMHLAYPNVAPDCSM